MVYEDRVCIISKHNRLERLSRLCNSLQVRLEIESGDRYIFTGPNYITRTCRGLWAAEMFMMGYDLALANKELYTAESP